MPYDTTHNIHIRGKRNRVKRVYRVFPYVRRNIINSIRRRVVVGKLQRLPCPI